MTNIGERVRTLVELVDSESHVIPAGSTGHVVGHQGERIVVTFEDRDTGTTSHITCERWDVYRLERKSA